MEIGCAPSQGMMALPIKRLWLLKYPEGLLTEFDLGRDVSDVWALVPILYSANQSRPPARTTDSEQRFRSVGSGQWGWLKKSAESWRIQVS
jgi:hypothetical protein